MDSIVLTDKGGSEYSVTLEPIYKRAVPSSFLQGNAVILVTAKSVDGVFQLVGLQDFEEVKSISSWFSAWDELDKNGNFSHRDRQLEATHFGAMPVQSYMLSHLHGLLVAAYPEQAKL